MASVKFYIIAGKIKKQDRRVFPVQLSNRKVVHGVHQDEPEGNGVNA
jgi:hypothetical protein